MLVVIAILVSVVLYTTDYMTAEVERYSIGMEITHAEESTYYIKNSGTRTTRTFYLRGDDKTMAMQKPMHNSNKAIG